MTYFSEREMGEVPRTETEVSDAAWGGFAALIQARIEDGSFGARYPETCPDGAGACGTSETLFMNALRAEIQSPSEGNWWMVAREKPPSLTVMDIVEFCWRAIGKPRQRGYHSYFSHHHLDYDVASGRAEFGEDVNRIFRRNGLSHELTPAGEVRRLAPLVLRDALSQSAFATGDGHLDMILEAARLKFLDPNEVVRREALEKLWDAWERLKTLEPGQDKKAQTKAILDRAAGSSSSLFRQVLETEATALTGIGNNFMIRHTETTKEPLASSEQVDHLFHRLFASIRLILRTTGRGG